MSTSQASVATTRAPGGGERGDQLDVLVLGPVGEAARPEVGVGAHAEVGAVHVPVGPAGHAGGPPRGQLRGGQVGGVGADGADDHVRAGVREPQVLEDPALGHHGVGVGAGHPGPRGVRGRAGEGVAHPRRAGGSGTALVEVDEPDVQVPERDGPGAVGAPVEHEHEVDREVRPHRPGRLPRRLQRAEAPAHQLLLVAGGDHDDHVLDARSHASPVRSATDRGSSA